MNETDLKKAEKIIGYEFKDISLLKKSLMHASQTSSRIDSNERLEFLGDAVLDLVICQRLYEKFPDYLEGDLTKIKSMLVSRRTCGKIAAEMRLDQCLNVGRGIAKSRSMTGSILAGALESIIAAVYLDGGLKTAEDFILGLFNILIEKADAEQHQENFKSLLQQFAQQEEKTTPVYELLDEKGPDHDKCFECAVNISGKRYRSAWGNNKKEAEQLAAYNALCELGVLKEDGEEKPDIHLL